MSTEKENTEAIANLFNSVVRDVYFNKEYVKAELQKIGHGIAIAYVSKILSEDQSVPKRIIAAYMLGETSDPAAIPPLGMALKRDTDDEVRGKAAQMLGDIGHTDAIPFLSDALSQDKDHSVRALAAQSLGFIGGDEAFLALSQALPKNDGFAGGRIATALAQIGGPKAVPVLGRALEEALDSNVRSQVIQALGTLKHVDGVPFLARALLNDPSPMNRSYAVEAIQELGDGTASLYLEQALRQDKDANVRSKVPYALVVVAKDSAIPVISETLVKDDSAEVRRAAAHALGQAPNTQGVASLVKALESEQDEEVRGSIAESLGIIGDVEAIPALSKALEKDKSAKVRESIVSALRRITHADTVLPLVRVLLGDHDRRVRDSASTALYLTSIASWQDKANQVISVAQQGKQQRSDVDAPSVLYAVHPSEEQLASNEFLLTDFLIEKTIGQDDRMTAILAKLIIESASESVLLAGDRVNNFEKSHKIPQDQLRKLRIEIGGEIALDPIMKILTDDLRKYFQKPIKQLNESTRANWEKTILYGQYGFVARMVMSVIVFAVGIALIGVSMWMYFTGEKKGDELFGPGVTFIAGLGSMLSVTYFGPLKRIRSSVNDLGIASAAFIGYVHRVLEISHTYSFYYLKERISFDEMTRSSQLIQQAMNNTVRILSLKEDREFNDCDELTQPKVASDSKKESSQPDDPASAVAPTVCSIEPAKGEAAKGKVEITKLVGTGFLANPQVILKRTGQTDIEATEVKVVSTTQITGNFDLKGKSPGKWDIVVINPDKKQGKKAEAFEVA